MSASSPCISICEVENGRCIGCGRTETEIAEWRDYPEEKRLAIMDRLDEEAANGGWIDAGAFAQAASATGDAARASTPAKVQSNRPGTTNA